MRIPSIIVAIAACAAIAGCSLAPIQNVSSAPTTNAAGKTLSREQVRAAIIRAGAGLGWRFADEGQDKLVGTLNLRTHTAVIEVAYSPSAYSIKYRSSVNLDEANGQIHKNYNGWIQNLTRGINQQLAAS